MSILGNPIMAGSSGGGGGSCAVELHGGPGETVTWSDGTNTGTVTLSAAGDSALSLPEGGYTFMFSLGSDIAGAIAASLVFGTTTIINSWGSKTPIYWFGRTFGYSLDSNNNATATINTNDITMSDTGVQRRYAFAGVVKGSNTSARAYIDTTGRYNSSMPGARIYGSSVTYTNELTPNNAGIVYGTITADSTVGVQYRPNSTSVAGGVILHALWLE